MTAVQKGLFKPPMIFAGAALLAALIVLLIVGEPAHAETADPLVSQITGGASAGLFSDLEPSSVAVDHADGRIYVADAAANAETPGDNVVYELDSSGHLLSTWTGVGTPAGTFGDSGLHVAVNEKTGDVLVSDPARELDPGHQVVDVFSSSGGWIETWTGSNTPAKDFAPTSPNGLAVDQATGEVYVTDEEHHVIDVFNEHGAYERQLTGRGTPAPRGEFGVVAAVAINDANDRVYVPDSFNRLVYVFSTTGTYVETWNGSSTPSESFRPVDLAADNSSGDVYVVDAENGVIDIFNAVGIYQGQLSDGLSVPRGIGIDQVSNEIYASNGEVAPVIDVFGAAAAVLPTTISGPVSNVQPTSATLNGTVDPEGLALTECRFEYVEADKYEPRASDPYDYDGVGHEAPCAESSAEIGSGVQSVEVHAEVSALTKSTRYRYRLLTANADGLNFARQGTAFATAGPPSVVGGSVSNVATTSAELDAQINPNGLSTDYRVEYGETEAYGEVAGSVEIPAGELPVAVSVTVSDLQPDTVYHFRYIAENQASDSEGHPIQGADVSFTTYPVSSGLPDGRVYELVTPLDNHNVNVYAPYWDITNFGVYDDGAELPFQAASDGNSVTFAGEPSPEGNGEAGGGAHGNQYLATRTENGWTQQDISPQGRQYTIYDAFSPSLSVAVLQAGDKERGLTPESSPLLPEAPAGYEVLYSRNDETGGERSLFTSFVGTAPLPTQLKVRFAGGSEDFATLLFEASAALAKGAPTGTGVSDLYESNGGQPVLVSVLPNGKPEPDASFGAPDVTGSVGTPDFSNDISASGARIFWSGLTSQGLYMSEVGAKTLQIDASNKEEGVSATSGGGQFWTASKNGGEVLFTDAKKLTANSTAQVAKAGQAALPDLYAYDSEAPEGRRLTDLTVAALGQAADVQGVLGMSEDGSYVYFVANGVLTTEANANHEIAAAGTCEPAGDAGECNLYVWHQGAVKFIARLAGADGLDVPGVSTGKAGGDAGDWVQGLGHKTSEVTPSGGDVVFISKHRLTKYDNEAVTASGTPVSITEVYVYDAQSGVTSCASCDPSGESPRLSAAFNNGGVDNGEEEGALLDPSNTPTRTTQWISEDGDEVFFDSAVPLVPEDTNGLADVYEWERGGTGSCHIAGGCVSLLSGGKSNDNSYLLDASANGSDVFFVTRAQLVSEDQGETFEVYDARVDGSRPPAPTSCPASGCQSAPLAPPSFATPASVTFEGLGNFAALVPSKPVVKAPTRGQLLAKALAACKHKAKKKRAGCEKQARKKYGPKPKAKPKAKKTAMRREGKKHA